MIYTPFEKYFGSPSIDGDCSIDARVAAPRVRVPSAEQVKRLYNY